MNKIMLGLTLILCFITYTACSPPGFTEFCRCFYHHPQTLMCNSNFIAKVKILKSKKLIEFESTHPWDWEYSVFEDGESMFMRDEFDAEVLEVYERTSGKSNKKVKLLVFPLAKFTHGCPPTSFHRGAGKSFLIAAEETDDGVRINGCRDFYQEWEDVQESVKRMVKKKIYTRNCNKCKVCTELFKGNKPVKSCKDTATNCVYNLNKDWNWDSINPRGKRGSYSIWGCHMAAGYCGFNKKKDMCQWKFDKIHKKKHC